MILQKQGRNYISCMVTFTTISRRAHVHTSLVFAHISRNAHVRPPISHNDRVYTFAPYLSHTMIAFTFPSRSPPISRRARVHTSLVFVPISISRNDRVRTSLVFVPISCNDRVRTSLTSTPISHPPHV